MLIIAEELVLAIVTVPVPRSSAACGERTVRLLRITGQSKEIVAAVDVRDSGDPSRCLVGTVRRLGGIRERGVVDSARAHGVCDRSGGA